MSALDKIRQARQLLEHAEADLATPETTDEPSVPGDIDRSGVTDVTLPLTEWLNSLPPNTTADLGGGVFRCETPIRLDNKTGLTIRNGTLTRTDRAAHGGIVYPKPNPHLWLMRPTRCTVENITFRGTNTVPDMPAAPWAGSYDRDYEFEAAIRLEQFTDCHIIGGTVEAVWGDGVQAQGGTGLTIDGLTVLSNGRQGITPLGRHFIIRNCDITSRRAGIDLEPDTDADNFGGALIEHNHIRSWLLAITSGGPGTYNDVEIRNNTITRSGVPCVNGRSSRDGRRDRWHVHHNRLPDGLGSPAAPFRFARSQGTVVEYNHSHHNPKNPPQNRPAAVSGEAGCEITVRNNWFENPETIVIDLDGTCTWVENDNHTGTEPPPEWWE